MADIRYERHDGEVASESVEQLSYDSESGHWLVFSREEGTVRFIPRERVFEVRESESEFEKGDDRGGW